jgi:hypothetical protein
MKGMLLMRGSTAAAALAFALGAAFVFARPAAAQTPPAQAPPAQKPPAQPAAPSATPAALFPEGAKVAYIYIQRVLEQSAEGKAATAKIGRCSEETSSSASGQGARGGSRR